MTTTILVIDDDPYTEMIVTAAIPPTWTVLGASNGLMGLDLLRQRHMGQSGVDLIVLDINMPTLDGYDTCVRIRQIAPMARILPFTGVAESSTILYMRELGCMPLLHKGCRVEVLAQQIGNALTMAPAPPPPSGLLSRLQQKALETELQARQADATRVALFATDPMTRLGLRTLLNSDTIAVQGEAMTEESLYALFATNLIQVLIAAGQDRAVALAAAREHGVPVVVVVPTFADAQVLARHDIAGVVVSAYPAAPSHVIAAVKTVAAGMRYTPGPLVESKDARAGVGTLGLTPRERTVLALDGPGVSPDMLAQALKVSRATILQYQSRIRRKTADAGRPAT